MKFICCTYDTKTYEFHMKYIYNTYISENMCISYEFFICISYKLFIWKIYVKIYICNTYVKNIYVLHMKFIWIIHVFTHIHFMYVKIYMFFMSINTKSVITIFRKNNFFIYIVQKRKGKQHWLYRWISPGLIIAQTLRSMSVRRSNPTEIWQVR